MHPQVVALNSSDGTEPEPGAPGGPGGPLGHCEHCDAPAYETELPSQLLHWFESARDQVPAAHVVHVLPSIFAEPATQLQLSACCENCSLALHAAPVTVKFTSGREAVPTTTSAQAGGRAQHW